MSDTKILQAILDGQTTIRKDIQEVKEEVKKTEGRLTARFDKVEKRVTKLENQGLKNQIQ